MVGDRLDADISGAARLGMRTVLRRTEQPQNATEARPDAILDDLHGLPAVLSSWL
jgi:FMN phosphatase YigB (HAD superfamily)